MSTNQKHQEKQKELLLEYLGKTPIILLVCEKVGVSRATFYRWKKADTNFAGAVEEALFKGKALVNDMAESQLISAIRDKNLTAIIFWLKNHHKDYRNRLDISGEITAKGELSAEQKESIMRALSMNLLPIENNNSTNNQKHENS